MPGSDEDVTRLIAVIERQRRELDHVRASAVGESVIAMARGALMERLGLSSAEAASQLAELSAATGVPLGEMAAAVLSVDDAAVSARPPIRRDRPRPTGPAAPAPDRTAPGRAVPGGARSWPRPRPSWPPTERNSPARWPARCWRPWTRPRS